MLTVASSLSDHDLLDRIAVLAVKERETSVELVAHLAALDARPSVHAARGFGSLFAYCTEGLGLSEDAACSRIAVARACRRLPAILESMASGALSLTSVRLLDPHLTSENGDAILARARGLSRREIEALIAELAPRPDVPSTVRKLPARTPIPAAAEPSSPLASPALETPSSEPGSEQPVVQRILTPPPTRPPVVENTSPGRYRVQFTIGTEGHETLRRLQALLRREIPNGDPGAIVERALALLLEKVERTKVGGAKNPRPAPVIRPGTDKPMAGTAPPRDVPRPEKREVWQRDGAQCAFIAPDGRRCTERAFLEFHHVHPYALGGPSTTDNISLRCRRHNQYEAQLVFGARDPRLESGATP